MYVATVAVVGGLIVSNLIAILFNGRLHAQTLPTLSEPHHSRFERTQGQPWLWISNRCSSVSYTKHANTFLAWDLVDPFHLIASYWVSPSLLLALRFCMLLQFAATVIVDGLIDDTINPQWLLGFKNWCSIMVGWTGLVGCLISTKHLTSHAVQSASPRATEGAHGHLKRHQSDVNHHTSTLSESCQGNAVPTDMACHWGPLDRVFLLALNTAAPVALLVPVLYWPYSNTLTHACVLQSIAVALLLLEVILSRAPFVSYQCQVYLLFCSAYMATLWAHHAVTGLWLCTRLDWSNASSILLYMGLLLLVIATWFTWYAIACFREALGSVLLQEKAATAFTTQEIAPVKEEPRLQQSTVREPSFASWTKTDVGEMQITAASADAVVQQSDSPVKRARHTSAASYA